MKDGWVKALKSRITSENGNISESDINDRINKIEEELFMKYKTSDDNVKIFIFI